MRRFLIIFLVMAIFAQALLPCYAVAPALNGAETIDLGNGLTAVAQTEVLRTTRMGDTLISRSWDVYDGSTLIASFSVSVIFYYDNITSYVVAKSLDNATAYAGWSVASTSLTSSGSTVYLSATLRNSVGGTSNVSFDVSCNRYGNIS